MSKTKSPLKHEEGNALAHAPYIKESDWHKKNDKKEDVSVDTDQETKEEVSPSEGPVVSTPIVPDNIKEDLSQLSKELNKKRELERLEEEQKREEGRNINTENLNNSFGSDNVSSIAEELNINSGDMDMYKSENANIYRVNDKSGEEFSQPKFVQVNDDGSTTLLNEAQVQDQDPNFFEGLNVIEEENYYSDLNNMEEDIAGDFEQAEQDVGTMSINTGINEEYFVGKYEDVLKKYNIAIETAGPGSDKIKLINAKGEEQVVSLNMKVFDSAPGVFGTTIRDNNAKKIHTQIKNFVEENGTQYEQLDYTSSVLVKNKKIADEIVDANASSDFAMNQSYQSVNDEIEKANKSLERYDFLKESSPEFDTEFYLNDQGYESLEQLQSIAKGEKEGLLSTGDITTEDIENFNNVTPEDKTKFEEYDKIFRILEQDYQDNFGVIVSNIKETQKTGGYSKFFGEIEISDEEKAVIIEMLEKNPKLKKDILASPDQTFKAVDNEDKNKFLQEVKNRVLELEQKKLKVKETELKIQTQDIENKSIEFENDVQEVNEIAGNIENDLNTRRVTMESLEQTIEMIDDVYLPEITKEMKELEKSAQTNPEDKKKYLELYERGKVLLKNRQNNLEKWQQNRKEYNEIVESDDFKNIAKRVDVINNAQLELLSEGEQLSKGYEDINKKKIKIFNEAGYTVLNGILSPQKDVYTSEKLYNEWMNQNKDNPTLDAVNTLVQGGADIFKDVLIGFPAEIAKYSLYSVENALYGKKGNLDDDRVSDVFGRAVDQLLEVDYLPVAERTEGMWDGGLTYKNAVKSLAELAPFTIGIIQTARKSVVKGPQSLDDLVIMGKNFGKKRSNQKLATQLAITKYTHKALLHDQIKMGEELGLDTDQAFLFGNASAFATAVSQLVMPDQNFLTSNAGKTFLSNLSNNLVGKTTLEAGGQVVYSSVKNYFKEFSEELIDAGFQDLAKFSFVANHNSEFMNAKNIGDLAMGTLFLSGTLQTAGNIKTIKAVKDIVYSDFQNNGEQVIQTLGEMIDDVEMKIQKTKDSKGIETNIKNKRLSKLEEQLEELKKSEVYARAVLNAKKSAPLYASTEHIDLIVQKNELIQSRKNSTGTELDEVNKKIKQINKKLEATATYEKYLNDQKKDRQRLNQKLKESGENVEVYESYSNEEVAEIIETNLLEESENIQAAIDQIQKDENGDALNKEDSESLANFKNRKKQIDNSITKLKSTEEQVENNRRAAIIKDRINKIDKSGKLSRRINIENAINKNQIQFELGLKDESEFKTTEIQLNNILSKINEEISSDNNIKESSELKSLLEQYEDLRETVQSDIAFSGYNNNAFITEDVSGKKTIVINKKQSLQSGFINSGQHEFLHYALKNTLKNDPVLQKKFAEAMMQFANDNPGKVKGGGEFNARISGYGVNEGVYEEYLTLMSEALVRKDVKYSNSFLGKMRDTIRRFKQRNGMQTITFKDVKDDGGESVMNFLRDFNSYFKSNKKNQAFDKMIREGAEGDLTKSVEKENQEIQERAYGPGFSKGLKNTFSSFPDIKSDFDNLTQNEDGSKKFTSKEEFRQSPEYWDGYAQILDNKGLGALIRQGVSDATGITTLPQIEEFEEKVRQKLLQRYEANFDPSLANGSLFGFFIGGSGNFTQSRLYRAKGDVMVDYTRQVETTNLESKQTAADKSLEIFQDEDFDTGRVKGPIGIKLYERLGPEAEAMNEKVKEVAATMKLDDLNFKTLKDLTPDLTQKLFGIKPKVGNLTKSDVKNAQMFINKHASTLLSMLPEGSTASGTSTGVQKVLLDAFYTKSDRAAMAKTGSKAGLAVQIKNENITPAQFLEVFGVTERGKPNLYKKDSNTSSRIKALVAQTGRMMTNQGVREYLNEQGDVKLSARLADGKSRIMFSKTPQTIDQLSDQEFEQRQEESFDDIVKRNGQEPVPNTVEGKIRAFNWLLNGLSKSEKKALAQRLSKAFILAGGTFDGTSDPIVKRLKILEEVVGKDVAQEIEGDIFDESGNVIRVGRGPLLFATNTDYKAEFPKNYKFGPDSENQSELVVRRTPNKDNIVDLPKLNKRSKGLLEVLNVLNEMIQEDKANIPYVAFILSGTSTNQSHFIRKGSLGSFLSTDLDGKIIPKSAKLTMEEHTQAASNLAKFMLNIMIDGKFETLSKNALDNYIQGALLSEFDNRLQNVSAGFNYKENAGRYSKMILIDGAPVWIRYFNPDVNGNNGGINPNVILLRNSEGKLVTLAENYGVGIDKSLWDHQNIVSKQQELLFDLFVGNKTQADVSKIMSDYVEVYKDVASPKEIQSATNHSKAVNNARAINSNTPSRGMSAFDFDETLIDKGENTIIATKGDVTVEISSSEWPLKGPQLAADGYNFDFTDFINVRGGVEGPLMQKFRNRIKKYGIENNYILTARPAESAPAIKAWLESQGIDMPIENITGLGNSTGEAKAMWMAGKYAEGYNDMYFVDDALPNVDAVKDMMEQLDIKGSSVQAKINFSKGLDKQFNDIIEQTTGMESQKRFSETQAELRGRKTKYKSIIPASAQDFSGLIYNFLGKGKQGEKHFEFFKKALIDTFARGINELNSSRQAAANDYKNLLKKYPEVKRKLNDIIDGSNFTVDQAVRVYLWNQNGFEVPGLSQRDLNNLTAFVDNDSDLKGFADAIGIISKRDQGYAAPGEYWLTENIKSDLMSDGAIGEVRSEFLQEFLQNKDIIFSPENLNKIQAIYGSKFREALEDILYRMETGRNRPTGRSRLMNEYMNWVNGSIGAIMFFNVRSAVLQTISSVNYINWTDNNPLKAAAAFANQKQYWKDFAFLFNSDFLKQRRTGNRRGINEAELSAAVTGKGAYEQSKAAIRYLLKIGFLPTQIADSFAIASGGATFYRNRIKSLMKDGMSRSEAEAKAFLDFQENTEASQQSARPDMISQQQADPLGRLILSFQNTPMQYARIMNKAARDLVNGRGDYKTHVSKIIYYGAIQGIIFGALQSALFATFGDEDDEESDKKKERILNQMIDSVLSGIGYGGKAISTIKNTMLEYLKQEEKTYNKDHGNTIIQALSFAPPIGSKIRKIYSAIKTKQYNEEVFKKRGLTIDNPVWSAIGNIIEGTTNIPLGRLARKLVNIENALDSQNETWQRIALVLGWSTWDLGITDPDIAQVKEDIKEEKAILREQEKERKKKERQVEEQIEKESKEKENIELQKQEKKEGKKVLCASINKSGRRCGKEVLPGSTYCTIHEKVEQNETGEKKQCTKIKSNGDRCKMKTSNKSGLCYYHD